VADAPPRSSTSRPPVRLEAPLAAAVLIDLDSRSDVHVSASLIEAAALAVGATRIPGGLLLAA
jgi:hypothetical protein